MKNKNWFLPYILIVVFAFTTFQQCQKAENAERNAESVANFLNDSIRYYKNELGQEIAHKSVLQGDYNSLKVLLSRQIDSTNQLKDLVDRYKNVLAAANITTETIIEKIEIPYEIPVEMEFTRDFSVSKQYYRITGVSTNNGITLDEIFIPNTQSLAIGELKSKPFKPSQLEISVVNSNPHVKTTGLDSFIYTVRPKRFGVSVCAGFGIGQNLIISPQVGIGVTYDFLQF